MGCFQSKSTKIVVTQFSLGYNGFLTTYHTAVIKDFAVNDTSFVRSTYGFMADPTNRIFDPKVRKSQISTEKQLINITYDHKLRHQIKTPREFDILCYKEGDFFDWHIDHQKANDHIATLLLYPPQQIIGGNLVIDCGEIGERTIVISSTQWTGVVLYLGIKHKVTPVESGTKIVYKAPLFLNETDKSHNKLISIASRDDEKEWWQVKIETQEAD